MRAQRGRPRSLWFILGLGAAAAAIASRWADLVAVRGGSMAPTLRPGDLLVVERWSLLRRPPRPGEVVLAHDPRQPTRELIKRVAAVRDGGIELRGDALASTDSRTFGTLPPDAIEWRVAFRYWPRSRIGRVPAAPHPGLADAHLADVGHRRVNRLGGRFRHGTRAQPIGRRAS